MVRHLHGFQCSGSERWRRLAIFRCGFLCCEASSMISPSSRKRLLGSRSGNVMIEFALSASMLVTLLLGTFQFGYAFYKYNALVNAVRGGTRYASMTKISN